MRLWKLKMKGTTRENEGWGNYSKTNLSQCPLEFSDHQITSNLGSKVSQMTREILGFRAIKGFNLATGWKVSN